MVITIERCIEEWCFDDDTDYTDPAAKAVNDRLQAELALLRRKAAALDALAKQQSVCTEKYETSYRVMIFECDNDDVADRLIGEEIGASLLEAIEAMEEK